MPRNNVVEVVGEFTDKATTPLKNLSGTVDGVARRFSLAALAGGTLAGTFALLVSNAAQALEADIKLEGAIKRLGENAGVTARQVNELGAEIGRLSRFGDEDVKSAAASLLLFDRVAGETFTRALRASADLAAVFGGDLSSATQALGRALQDPERGLRQLRRAGINFTEDQIALLKVMNDTGRQAEAQAVILSELEKRTKGAAEETRNTLGGAMIALKNNFLDLLEGGGSSGPLPRVVGWINALTDALARTNQGSGDLVDRLQTALDRYEPKVLDGTASKAEIEQVKKLRAELKLERERLRREAAEPISAPIKDLSTFEIDAYILANSALTVDIDAQIKERERLQADAIARGETRAQRAFQAEIDMLVSKGQLSEAVATENARAIEEIMDGLEDAVADSIPDIQDPIEDFTTSLQNAFEGMVRTGQFSMRQLVRFMIAELARKELFAAIDGIGNALRDALGAGGKASGFLKAAGSFLGFAAGGGMGSGARIVGEEGPELLLSPGRVMNRRQLAFAAGGSGGGITYAPQAVFNVNGDPNPQLLAALNAEWERKRKADQIGFVEMLERNGLGRMR
jgi:phage-related minor tail protein